MKKTIVLGLLFAGLGVLPAHGIMNTWTWNGGGADANWTTVSNWTATLSGTAPENGGIVQFAGSLRLTPNNNESNLQLNGIIFEGSHAFTLTGNPVSLGGASGVANNSDSIQTIDMGITLTAAQTFAANSAPLVFSGTIDGAYPLTLTGPYPITLGGAVGSVTPLNSVTDSGAVPVTMVSITATGNVDFSHGSGVHLAGNATVQSTAGNVNLGTATVQGNGYGLMVAASGTTTLNGAVGLNTLSVAGGGVFKPSGTLGATGNIDLSQMSGTMQLGGNTWVSSATANVTGPVQPVQGNGYGLMVAASGTTTLNGAVGLNTLSVAGGGLVVLSQTTSASGSIDLSLAGTVALGSDMLVTSSTLAFAPIQGNGHSLTVTTSGPTTIPGGAGLANLSVAGGGLVTVSGGTLAGTGNLNLSAAGTLALGSGMLVSGGTLALAPVQGNGNSLTVTASGPITIPGGTGLANLSVAGGGLVTVSGGTLAGTGNLNLSAAGTLALGSDMLVSSTGAGNISLPAVQGNLDKLTIDTSGLVTFDGEVNGVTTLDVFGSVVNNSTLQVPNGTSLIFNGPVVNYGAINALSGNVIFYSTVMNYGTIITSNCPPVITAIQVVGLNVEISFTTCSNVPYEVDYDTDLVSGTWTTLTNLTAAGSITSVIDPGAAVLPQRFYRAGLLDQYQ